MALVAACSSGETAGTKGGGDTPEAVRSPVRRDEKETKQARDTSCPTDASTTTAGDAIPLSDVTDQRGLVEPLKGMYGHASALADVNADGWVDLFVGTFDDRPKAVYQQRGATGPGPDRLLLGGPDGFKDAVLGIAGGRSSSAAFADLDGDGDLDLVVGRNVKGGGGTTTIVVNDNGSFAGKGQVLAPTKGARGIGVLDYDGDGRLDLFVTEDKYRGGKSVLLRNGGGLRFEDATADAGLPADIDGLSVAAADLTGDGWPDLFVPGSPQVYVNTGSGRFKTVEVAALAWKTYGNEDDVAGVDVADLNRDGQPDLVVGQHFNSTVDDGCRVPVRVYLSRGVREGAPAFDDVTERAGIPALPTKAPHVQVEDFDNDGWPDVLVTASAENGTRPVVLRHRGLRDGVPQFTTPPGLGDEQYWITAAVGDVDRDGRQDVLLVEYEPAKPSLLLRNGSGAGNWLDVQVPASWIGAVVRVYPDGRLGDPSALLWRQEVVVTRGNAAGGPPVVHVGLGGVTSVDVRIERRGAPARDHRGVRADTVLCAAGPAACAR